ncbi:primosomal protein N', partial [candidate division KSB1 bacterium]|nr:primosomal protein N' [candidate division KSB1 bacterium]
VTGNPEYDQELKNVQEVLDPVPLFSVRVLQLARWIADYYLCGWGEVLKAALPAGIHVQAEKIVILLNSNPAGLADRLSHRAPRQAEIVRLLTAENPLPVRKLSQHLPAGVLHTALQALHKRGDIRTELALPRARVAHKWIEIVKLPDELDGETLEQTLNDLSQQAPKQADCLRLLSEHPTAEWTRSDLIRETAASSSAIKGLLDKNLLQIEKRRIFRNYYGDLDVKVPEKLTLNPDQEKALKDIRSALDQQRFHTLLLHGVTGSGKTQVYIEAIAHALSQGRSAIVLVPEIALTPQTVRRFTSHFHDQVAVFHSRMSPGERYDSWRRTWEGHHQIVIGPRSAIFAPLKQVGLIVVDEEHDTSYKQHDLTPRYNARDVAIVRAHLNEAVVILGSATPSVESYFNSTVGKYTRLDMPSRIDDIPMPEVHIVDLSKEPRVVGRQEPTVFSRLLRSKMDEKLAAGEQIILLQNRRGFATVLKCKSCGYSARCENCDISLTYHITHNQLRCHYCGYTRRAPSVCPDCQSRDIFLRGVGTQRVEEEIERIFPGVQSLRMDWDTTRGRRGHDRILDEFGSGKYSILLGTQMVAKGLDFPNVSLVGVISADTELLFPDFRSGERTFQLLTQVAGRAGRKNKVGEVVIQTYSPDHYSLVFARQHDYTGFFRVEIADRRSLGYPPFGRMIQILFQGPDAAQVQIAAEQFQHYLADSDLYTRRGPASAPLTKIQGNYRWQILLLSLKYRDSGGQAMKKAIEQALSEYKKRHRQTSVRLTIDVDPASIL